MWCIEYTAVTLCIRFMRKRLDIVFNICLMMMSRCSNRYLSYTTIILHEKIFHRVYNHCVGFFYTFTM